MQIKHLLRGTEDLLVKFIDLFLRWVFNFWNFNGSAKGHGHLDASWDGEAEATPVQEERRLTRDNCVCTCWISLAIGFTGPPLVPKKLPILV